MEKTPELLADLEGTINSITNRHITDVQVEKHEEIQKMVRALPAFRAIVREQHPKLDCHQVEEFAAQQLDKAKLILDNRETFLIDQLRGLGRYRILCLHNWWEGQSEEYYDTAHGTECIVPDKHQTPHES